MKKRTVAVLTALLMAVMITGCSMQKESESSSSYSTKEIWVNDGERRIYGQAYIPEGEGKFPLVIFCHELGSNLKSGFPYGERIAEHGCAFYTFDFCGGSGDENRSDGDTHQMSVITEMKDLKAVMKEAATWDFVDSSKIILMGGSQGGVVSAFTAAEMPDAVNGLILMYPAFNIEDDIHSTYADKKDIPDEIELLGGWIMVGRNYATDIWDIDFYEKIKGIRTDTLLIHGNSDTTVDISYSDRASKTIENCDYHVLENAGHEFQDTDFEDAVKLILLYLDQHK